MTINAFPSLGSVISIFNGALKSNSILSKLNLYNCTKIIKSIKKCYQRLPFSQILMKHTPRSRGFRGTPDLHDPYAHPHIPSDTQAEEGRAARTRGLWDNGILLYC